MNLISKLFLFSAFVFNVSSFTFNVNSPYDKIVWPSNTDAVIKFSLKPGTPTPPGDFKICIDLMRGDPADSQQLLTISCDVPWNITEVYWKVPDFPSNNDYFVRVGSPGEWAYSHTFTVQGKGTTPLPKPRPTDLPPSTTPTPIKIDSQNNNSTKSTDNNGNSFRAPSGDYTYQPQNANLDKDKDKDKDTQSSSKQSTKSDGQTFNLPIIFNLLLISFILSL